MKLKLKHYALLLAIVACTGLYAGAVVAQDTGTPGGGAEAAEAIQSFVPQFAPPGGPPTAPGSPTAASAKSNRSFSAIICRIRRYLCCTFTSHV